MTVNEIMEWMLSEIPPNYDISEGSFFYDLLYPVAVQIYMLRTKAEGLTDEAFALTASGEYLDRKVAEQGLTRRGAGYAKGTLKITGNAGEVLHSGTKFASENILYSTDETVTIPTDGIITVPATCTVSGSVGNVKAGTINRMPITIPGIKSVINEDAFTGGYDAEDDETLRDRYMEKVSRPNVSGNKYHYIEWAKEVSGVGNAQVIPLWDGAGTVKVIITNTDNQPADEDLISRVTKHIEDNRPIGANVTVVSAEAITIDVSVTLVSEIDVQSEVENILKEYLSDVTLKQSYVSYAKIGGLILSIPGVEDYSNLKINNSTSNISINDGSVPILGSVVLS